MHNRDTAQKFQAQPTGNARAEDFRVEPIIRMRCTYMAPRDQSLEELVKGVKQGYYFKSFRGGQANLDGTFQVGIQEGYEIVNGEIGERFLGQMCYLSLGKASSLVVPSSLGPVCLPGQHLTHR